MPNQGAHCDGIIWKIGQNYHENIYVNINIPICFVGMILNLLNVLVFTRKTMNSPTNLILAHLAVVDFLVLLTRLANHCMTFIEYKNSYTLTLVHEYNQISLGTFQFISAVLTVQLAAWRYIAIVHPLNERHWCTERITRNVVITGYVVCCVLFAIPRHLSFDICIDAKMSMNGKTKYKVTFEGHPIMDSIRIIIYGLAVKLLPSVLLLGLTFRIVMALLARTTRREQFASSASTRANIKNAQMRRQANRSTAILLTVAALFFIGEFPRGILWFMKMINDSCYYSLRGIFITIINIYTSITFIIYYALSQQFRTTFKSLFCSCNPRTGISHQIHAPFALGDTEETNSGRNTRTSEV